MAELKEPEKEEELEFLVEEDGGVNESHNISESSSKLMDDDIQSLYAKNNHGYGLNDMGRNAGIIMDEDKLEAHKVTEWHRPDKIRESKLRKFFKGIWSLITWPFRALMWLVSGFFRGVYVAIATVVGTLIKLIKNIFILSWEFITAFKYVWIYFFGEVSWFQKKELMPVAVKIEAQPRTIIWKKVTAFVVLALCLVLPFQIYSTYYQAKNIRGEVLGVAQVGLDHLQQAGEAGTNFDFNKAGYEFNLAEENFKAIKNDINELGVVANKLGDFIPDVKVGKELIEVAELVSQIGRHVAESASWLSEMPESLQMAAVNDKTVTKEVNLIQANYEIKLALGKAEQANEILENIKLSGTKFADYNEEFNNLKNNLPNLLNWLKEGNEVIDILSYVLAIDEPHRWMLVFQNNTELRPTGGFMGSYAIVDVKDAKIKDIDVPGGGFYDLKGSLAVKVDAPYPFHLFSPIWQPWNANWFYDWPTSAEKIEWFYEKSGGSSVDGVIAFTPKVLVDLLKIVGEIDMPEYGLTINSENFVREAQLQVEFEYDKEENKPKKFIGDLMPKILEKLGTVDNQQLMPVLQLLIDNFKEKHLLVYLNDENLQSKIEKLGWAGEVKNSQVDYLAVVHTNIAGGKTDGVIDITTKHEVEILADGSVINTVSLSKTHQGRVDDVFEGQTNVDYLRFYVPQGSELLSAQGFDAMPGDRVFQEDIEIVKDPHLEKIEKNLRIDTLSNTRITDEFNKTVFANWLVVAPGETKEVIIKYLLPVRYKVEVEKVVTEKTEENFWQLLKRYFFGVKQVEPIDSSQVYSLLLQKQPGINGGQFESIIKLNKDWEIVDYQPKENIVLWEEGTKFVSDLKTDKYYQIKFQD